MRLEDMELFVTVVQTGSFTRAAEYSDLPKSTVSRRIRNLEESLHSRLLERTTRSVMLTEVGEVFYQKCQAILEQVEATQQEISQSQDESIGNLTVYAPDHILELCIDQVSDFCHQHPQLSLMFQTICQPLTLMADKRFDLLIDIGSQPDSSFIAHPIADVHFDFFAHVDYLKQHGEPSCPQDLLLNHNLIVQELPSQAIAWNHAAFNLPSSPKYMANSPYIVRGLTTDGQGIGVLPIAMVTEALEQGELVQLFGGRYAFKQTIYGIYHSRRYVPKKVKVLIDNIKAYLPERINGLEQRARVLLQNMD